MDTDVSEADRMRIAGEAEVGEAGVQHRALLATEDSIGGLPQAFDIHGKDSLPIQPPDGTTVTTAIAASYSDFFTLDMCPRQTLLEMERVLSGPD